MTYLLSGIPLLIGLAVLIVSMFALIIDYEYFWYLLIIATILVGIGFIIQIILSKVNGDESIFEK